MSEYIFFNREYNVLICKAHQHAISSRYVTRHFLQEHDISLSGRQAIQAYASQYVVTEAAELLYSSERIPPIPYLRIINGFQCQYDMCTKIQGTLDSMKRHCRMEHSWKSKNGEYWIETRAQTFYQGNDQQYYQILAWVNYRYFAVHEPGTLPNLTTMQIGI